MIFRWLGKICLAFALFFLGLGLYLWLSGADMQQAGGLIWYQTHAESLGLTQVVIERYLYASWFWKFFQGSILTLPVWDGILRIFITLMLSGGFLLGLFKKGGAGQRRGLHQKK